MKKIYLLFIAITMSITSFAQSRKYVSQFSHMQSYFNPALTGYEGSNFRGLIRNQWVGFEGAPMTYFGSVEFDIADFSKGADPNKNALGVNVLHDQYGAFVETEMIGSYASRIQVGEKTAIRLGMGVSYNQVRLDGNSLTTEQASDPVVGQYLNSFANMQVLDFNIGMALTHPNYYVSYAVSHVNKGAINSGDVFMERKPRVGIFQAGYRNALSQNLALATNFMYRTQQDLPDNIEFNFKVLMMDRIWLGGGHRIDYANNFQLGVLFPMIRIGYVYELPMNKSYLLPNTTHEFLAVIPLFKKNIRSDSKEVLIW
ncbi:type IX secretion system membrane protein PorP/SprF [Belliella sp. DSM 111904]|uniref:Type IX secretion system membrane protein PorP/SprF n=1 Tax=Belliella filtrata TaxID=2923435 RepID=A0ABS9V552_9BACT|nr:type IX secretion system membrane protein PorP/SprF [Belliella filtrata]MCH7411546.1 type IX secretion system membrane protein PorP/SprF [Belliella filtrata]